MVTFRGVPPTGVRRSGRWRRAALVAHVGHELVLILERRPQLRRAGPRGESQPLRGPRRHPHRWFGPPWRGPADSSSATRKVIYPARGYQPSLRSCSLSPPFEERAYMEWEARAAVTDIQGEQESLADWAIPVLPTGLLGLPSVIDQLFWAFKSACVASASRISPKPSGSRGSTIIWPRIRPSVRQGADPSGPVPRPVLLLGGLVLDLNSNAGAMTLDDCVFVRSGNWEPNTYVHEMVHVGHRCARPRGLRHRILRFVGGGHPGALGEGSAHRSDDRFAARNDCVRDRQPVRSCARSLARGVDSAKWVTSDGRRGTSCTSGPMPVLDAPARGYRGMSPLSLAPMSPILTPRPISPG